MGYHIEVPRQRVGGWYSRKVILRYTDQIAPLIYRFAISIQVLTWLGIQHFLLTHGQK